MTDRHCADTLDYLEFHRSDISDRIREMVRAVDRDNAAIGVLSTGEQCAVALVLDRPDSAERVYGSLLGCAVRVGPEALSLQSNGWTEPAELDHA